MRAKIKDDKMFLQAFDEEASQIQTNLSQKIYQLKSIATWWNQMNNFVRTLAQWSMMGYFIGLGDRHQENILFSEDMKFIHIDFEYNFDQGLGLPFPEWVPFRLTKCLVEPLGILGEFGLFYAESVKAAIDFQSGEKEIWKALSNFTGFL